MADNCAPPTSQKFSLTATVNSVLKSWQTITKSRSSTQIPFNIFTTPITSTLSSGLTGTVLGGAVGAFTASEFAKVGKKVAGTPGEISAAILGAGTGIATGFLIGSIIGAFSGDTAVNYYLRGPVGELVEENGTGVTSQLNSLTKLFNPSTYLGLGNFLNNQSKSG